MRFVVYILKSEVSDRFYVGQTSDIESRLKRHNEGHANKFTLRFRPWTIFHLIECTSREQAKKIEAHIKRAKSKKYIADLKNYPAIEERLMEKYAD
jgi:putative endonuclease